MDTVYKEGDWTIVRGTLEHINAFHLYHNTHYAWLMATPRDGGITSIYFKELKRLMGAKDVSCLGILLGEMNVCSIKVPKKILFILNVLCSRLKL